MSGSYGGPVMGVSGLPERSDGDRGTVVAIGVFDGVHRGHQGLISRARERADALGLSLVAVTFDPHPASVVPGRHAPEMLTTLAERTELLRSAGADQVVVLRFDEKLARMDPAEFVDEVLVGELGARVVVVGENFRFGHQAAGDVEVLSALGAERELEVIGVPLHPADLPWSSSRVRQALASGEVEQAAHLLGRPYRLSGVIVHGDHRGRELGYPTANLDWQGHRTVPAEGVYAGWLIDSDAAERLPAAISVGTNPQFAGQQQRVEAYVIDRSGLDLYGHRVAIEFVERLRSQETFDSVDGLIAQMGRDVDTAREVLARSEGFPGRAKG